MSDNFEYEGREFAFEAFQSSDNTPPWEEHDGHGEIRTMHQGRFSSRREKKPGEVILHDSDGTVWLYDFAGTLKIAAKDGWGMDEKGIAKLTKQMADKQAYLERCGRSEPKPARVPTKKEITVQSVKNDMDFCRDYLRGEINSLVIKVWAIGAEDDERYLGAGFLEWNDPYLLELAKELAGEIIADDAKHEATLDLHMAGL